MSKKMLFYAVLMLLALFSYKVKAQIGRSEWSYGVILQSDNIVYSELGSILSFCPVFIVAANEDQEQMEKVEEFYVKNLWWIPSFRYRANIVQSMDFPEGKATVYPKAWGLSNWDWKLNNYSVGYHVGYLSRIYPIGFDLQADYIQDGYKIKMKGADEKKTIVKRMFSATALLKVRLLKYDANRINPVIELGGGYHYAFHYHDDVINDKGAVKNGFTGIIGIGFTNTETHFSWSLRYEHSFYDFYNEDFVYEGVPVFAGTKSTFGKLGVAVSYGF